LTVASIVNLVRLQVYGRGNFEGERASHCEVLGHSAVSCAKMAEPIDMLFRLWIQVEPRNHVLDVGPDRPKWVGNF